MFSKIFCPVKCNFFPTPTYNWLLLILVYIFRRLKGKIKNEDNWLALKVLIQFKIEIVYSLWKPVIWKYNFPNSLNVQSSSRNVKFDSYREKRNSHLTFSVIKLVLLWHKLCYWIQFFFFWKCWVRSQVFYVYSEWLLSFIFLS